MHTKLYILTLLIVATSIAQEWNYSADIAELKTINNQKVKQFDGNVVINREALKLTTKKAIQYVDKNEIHLFGDIIMINEESKITCDKLIYYINDEFCKANDNVILNQKDNIIQSDTLFYWDVKDSLRAIGNIKINQKDNKRRLLSHEMYLFNRDSTTQILELSKSSEVYNIIESRVS